MMSLGPGPVVCIRLTNFLNSNLMVVKDSSVEKVSYPTKQITISDADWSEFYLMMTHTIIYNRYKPLSADMFNFINAIRNCYF